MAALRWQALALGLVVAFAGCEDDEAPAIDLGPTGFPSLAFSDPPSDGPQPVCVAVGPEIDARVPLLVDLTELVLRPPGACGLFPQCGHLELWANGILNNEAAVPAVELLLRKLADRYHDGTPHAGTGEPDVVRVRVQMVSDSGVPMSDHAGEPLADELELITVPSCEGLGGGGSGGAGGFGGSGGAGGAGGSGGAGGAGGAGGSGGAGGAGGSGATGGAGGSGGAGGG
jgi:hypothetical protein